MKWIVRLIYILVFVGSMALIAIGQRRIGPLGLSIILVGLAVILILLYLYNKKFQ